MKTTLIFSAILFILYGCSHTPKQIAKSPVKDSIRKSHIVISAKSLTKTDTVKPRPSFDFVMVLAMQHSIDSLQHQFDHNGMLYYKTHEEKYRIIANRSEDKRVRLVKKYYKYMKSFKQ